MSFAEILLIAVGLAMDAFAVSVAAGAAGVAVGPRPVFRLSFHFGLFQFLMPILGWLAGAGVARELDGADHWIAAALLVLVGVRMIRSSLDPDQGLPPDPSRGRTLLALCVATSIDAFAVGLSLAMLQINIVYPSLVIGVVTSGMSLVGIELGSQLSRYVGKRMGLLGGLVLVAIACRIIVELFLR